MQICKIYLILSKYRQNQITKLDNKIFKFLNRSIYE